MTNASNDLPVKHEILVPISVDVSNYNNLEYRPDISDDGELIANRTYVEYGNWEKRFQMIFEISFEDFDTLVRGGSIDNV